jgi:mRNA-degrading endonuclease RelE of RelBE toxin-antitoxin system
MADIEYSTNAAETLESMDSHNAERIVDKLEDVVWKPEHYSGVCKSL